ncbi:pheromone/general odorant binding protein, partial [Salmonella enterica subsp. enterica serovar 1,4,[5],12:i:-]|nr:pheromone/general odorant binding protein [Salmonella enterica subsp. enterica serovar 1,4,[5],12:i:-]
KVSSAALQKFFSMSTDLDDSKESKCFMLCAMQAWGGMKDDGTLDLDHSKTYIDRAFVGTADKVMASMRMCKDKEPKGDDLCHYAYAYSKCFNEELKRQNIPLPQRQ